MGDGFEVYLMATLIMAVLIFGPFMAVFGLWEIGKFIFRRFSGGK